MRGHDNESKNSTAAFQNVQKLYNFLYWSGIDSAGPAQHYGCQADCGQDEGGRNPGYTKQYLPTNFNTKIALRFGGLFLCIYLKRCVNTVLSGFLP